jgi:hypothetical protein
MKKTLFIIVSICILIVSSYVFASSFSDTAGHWAEQYIDELTNQKIINGYTDGTYKPDGPIKRGEFLKLIMMASKPDVNWSLKNYKYNHWSSIYSNYAENKKIVPVGFADENTAEKEITRIEVATILGKCDIYLREHNQRAKSLSFTDTKELDKEQKVLLEHCVGSEYINGFPDGTFKPNDTLTRAQVAKILYVFLNNK